MNTRPAQALLATLCVASLVMWGCLSEARQPAKPSPPYPAVDAAGRPIMDIFEGRVPCHAPRCEKMKVAIVLYRAPGGSGGSYWMGRVLVGDDSGRVVSVGAWSPARGATGYPNAEVYVLDDKAPAALRRHWRLTRDILLPLDEGGTPKAGNAAWGYMLTRRGAVEAPNP